MFLWEEPLSTVILPVHLNNDSKTKLPSAYLMLEAFLWHQCVILPEVNVSFVYQPHGSYRRVPSPTVSWGPFLRCKGTSFNHFHTHIYTYIHVHTYIHTCISCYSLFNYLCFNVYSFMHLLSFIALALYCSSSCLLLPSFTLILELLMYMYVLTTYYLVYFTTQEDHRLVEPFGEKKLLASMHWTSSQSRSFNWKSVIACNSYVVKVTSFTWCNKHWLM